MPDISKYKVALAMARMLLPLGMGFVNLTGEGMNSTEYPQTFNQAGY
jgi:hypothetical protein